jgi:hypothetical protein
MHIPHFLSIGAQKTATKWLYWNLQKHPDIYLPWGAGEEVHFFDSDRWFGNVQWYSDHYPPSDKIKWPDNILLGDITPDYAILPLKRIEFVKKIMPEAEIFYTLRNPKWRSVSHLRMVFTKTKCGYENEPHGPELFPWDPVDKLINFCEYGSGWDHSNYVLNIQRWREVFGDKLHVLSYDDITRDPKSFLQRVFRTLKIDDTITDIYPIEGRYHVSETHPINNDLINELDRIYNPVIEDLAKLVDFDVSHWLSSVKPKKILGDF